MHLTGLRTMRQIRRARRDFAAKHPRVQTSEDRAARRRMDALVYVLVLCFVVIPGAVAFADYLTGLHYLATMAGVIREAYGTLAEILGTFHDAHAALIATFEVPR